MRRRHDRFEISDTRFASVRVWGGDIAASATVRDLSYGGFRATIPQEAVPPPGDTVVVTLVVAGQIVNTMAKVAHVGQEGVGFEFAHANPKAILALHRLISALAHGAQLQELPPAHLAAPFNVPGGVVLHGDAGTLRIKAGHGGWSMDLEFKRGGYDYRATYVDRAFKVSGTGPAALDRNDVLSYAMCLLAGVNAFEMNLGIAFLLGSALAQDGPHWARVKSDEFQR